MRQTFFSPVLRALAFLIFASVSIEAQVIIKERVSIDPKSPAPVASSTPSGPLLVLDGNTVKTTVPGVILSGSLTISPGAIPNNTGYEVWVNLGGSSFLIRKRGTGYCLDTTAQEMNPFPMTLPGCGAIGMSARTFVPAPWVWSCAVREAGLETPQVSGNTATFVANGTLWYTSFTATLTVTALLDESYQVAEVIVEPNSDTLTCGSATTVNASILNGFGNLYTGCNNSPIPGTASLTAEGPYALLASGEQIKTTVNLSFSGGSTTFLVIHDPTRGEIPDGTDVATIAVSVGDATGTTSIVMRCGCQQWMACSETERPLSLDNIQPRRDETMQGCGSDEAGIARVLYTTESFADIKACKDPEGSFRLWTNMVNAEIRYRLCPTVLSGKADVSSISTLDQAREALTDLLVWKRLHEEYLRYVDAGCGSQPILPDITGLRYAASEEILNHEVEHASLLKSLLESVATKFDKRLRSKSLHPYTSCTEIERQIKKSKNEITKEFDRKYEDTDRKCSDEAKARRVGLNTLNRIIKEIRLKWHI